MLAFLNRELSWLSFNERVLQEAKDPSLPLVERIRFLGIYSNNMDEFFRVRVANVRRMMLIENNDIEGYSGTSRELFEEIRHVVMEQQKSFERTYNRILVDFSRHNIFHITEKDLNKEQKKELKEYFEENLKHAIVPMILTKNHPFPRLKDYQIYLAVKLSYADKKKVRFAAIQIPEEFSRFHELRKGDQRQVIILDDIIRLNLASIFSIFNFEKIEAYTFKCTRDAELNLDDDISVSFFDKIEKSVKLRKKGDPLRFVFDQNMPDDMLEFLLNGMNMNKWVNTIPGGKYHNFKDFRQFPDFGNPDFIYPKREPLPHKDLDGVRSIFKVVQEKDVLLHFPYHKFSYVVDMLREAAIDPKVISIKINVYRVAHNSQIMNALMTAASNGKEVTAVFELQARFDEENNLYWSNRLRENGAKVLYGSAKEKIHSKLLQVKRVSGKKVQMLSYIGTGNFHEGTARVYGDLALLTSDSDISREVKKVFDLIENKSKRVLFRTLLVSPNNNRRRIYRLIENEIATAKEGNKAFIRIKMNNLVDIQMIQKLYKASNAGVKIQLIIRGICCLIPGLHKKSDNIEIISIVDRYLEHARFMIFSNNGQPLYYLTSADLMSRNLDNRIEVGTPIFDKSIQKDLEQVFDIQWNGNVKVRILDKKMKNDYRLQLDEKPFRAQEELYKYYKKLIEN
jgi:polyphosphate kinase